MKLAQQQNEFMAHVLEEDRPLPPGWNARMAAGLAIYRNAYRARLVDALRETFARTARWVGDEAFAAAAAHHLISHPPSSWTLDLAGKGFDRTLAELFANDPEVPELAWLEWAMHRAFVAADTEPLDGEGFVQATLHFAEEDWAGLRLAFVPSLDLRPVSTDCGAIWQSLAEEGARGVPGQLLLDKRAHCIVWREGFAPVFRIAEAAEGECLGLMRQGATFGAACEDLGGRIGEEAAVAQAGAMLGQWIAQGIVWQVAA